MPILALCSSTGSLRPTGKTGYHMWTDRQTYTMSRTYTVSGTSRLIDSIGTVGQFSENELGMHQVAVR